MHLFVVMRGHKMWMDQFVNELQSQYLPYRYEKGKIGMVQLAVRPIQLFDVVFPEEHLEKVLGMLQPYDSKNTKFAFFLRKLMKLLPIPKKRYPRPINIFGQHVDVTGVGIKKDERSKDSGIEML